MNAEKILAGITAAAAGILVGWSGTALTLVGRVSAIETAVARMPAIEASLSRIETGMQRPSVNVEVKPAEVRP